MVNQLGVRTGVPTRSSHRKNLPEMSYTPVDLEEWYRALGQTLIIDEDAIYASEMRAHSMPADRFPQNLVAFDRETADLLGRWYPFERR